MKNFAILMLATLIFSFTSSAKAQIWPGGELTDFPWMTVSGFWLAQDGNYKTYYSLTAISTGEIQILKVEQLDYKTRSIVAEGYGRERDDVVTAVLAGNNVQYQVAISYYADKKKQADNQLIMIGYYQSGKTTKTRTFFLKRIYSY